MNKETTTIIFVNEVMNKFSPVFSNFNGLAKLSLQLKKLLLLMEEEGKSTSLILLFSNLITVYMETDLLTLEFKEEEYLYDLTTIADVEIASDQVAKIANKIIEKIDENRAKHFNESVTALIESINSIYE